MAKYINSDQGTHLDKPSAESIPARVQSYTFPQLAKTTIKTQLGKYGKIRNSKLCDFSLLVKFIHSLYSLLKRSPIIWCMQIVNINLIRLQLGKTLLQRRPQLWRRMIPRFNRIDFTTHLHSPLLPTSLGNESLLL